MTSAVRCRPLWLRSLLWLAALAGLWLLATLLIVAYTLKEDGGERAGWTIKYRTWLYYLVSGDNPNAQLRTPRDTLASFEVYPGYRATLYASEVDFPIGAPVAINFDDRGRLWVASAPTYPHLLPGELPRDSIVILEDSDRDGVADRHTVFADQLYLPMGFALVEGGALIVQAPDVILARDRDGDGVMDDKEIVLSGFGTADSHHVISALEWGPDGALYLQDGWFLRSQVETPYGPQRLHDGGVWRYEPATQKLDIVASYNFTNPWGHVFDDWGQSILCDASGGDNYYLAYLMAPNIYPEADKHNSLDPSLAFLRRGRPTAGCDIVSSPNFAAQDQGRFLVNQSIGFHGVRWNHIEDDPAGAGFATIETDADLLQSDDSAFRPVAMEFGPDGALYVLDFYSPVIGHMQFSVRDERRDKTHGRIWRIAREGGSTTWQPSFHTLSLPQLLQQLQSPWAPWRFHARRRLQQMDAATVLPALDDWLSTLDATQERYSHHLLEALWVHAGVGSYPMGLLRRMLADDDYRARAAAARLYRFVPDKGPEEMSLLRAMLEDPHPRVRLEGMLNAAQMNSAAGAGLALLAANAPMDEGMQYTLARVLKALAVHGEPQLPGDAVVAEHVLLRARTTGELLSQPADRARFDELITRADLPAVAAQQLLREQAELEQRPAGTLALEALASPGFAAPADGFVAAIVNAPQERLPALARSLEQTEGDNVYLRRALLGVQARLSGAAGQLNEADVDVDVLSVAAMLEDDRLRAQLMPVVRAIASGERAADAASQRLAVALAPDAASPAVRDFLRRYDDGLVQYPKLCGNCHGDAGQGMAGAFPPLAGSDWLLADRDRAIRVVLHGLQGPITVNGVAYRSMMAPLGAVADDQTIAAVLTYVFNSWGNRADPVTAAEVAALRAADHGRQTPWTAAELQDAARP